MRSPCDLEQRGSDWGLISLNKCGRTIQAVSVFHIFFKFEGQLTYCIILHLEIANRVV